MCVKIKLAPNYKKIFPSPNLGLQIDIYLIAQLHRKLTIVTIVSSNGSYSSLDVGGLHHDGDTAVCDWGTIERIQTIPTNHTTDSRTDGKQGDCFTYRVVRKHLSNK